MIGRLSAAEELKSYGNDKSALMVWSKLAVEDSFWAVRQAALENLGKYSDGKDVELFKACLTDGNSRVRQSAVRILGDLKDPELIKLFEKRFMSENSYAVQAEALKSIGKCGSKQQLSFLKKAEAMKSYNNIVSKAATYAISMITPGLTK
jgi:aminopeptidase N